MNPRLRKSHPVKDKNAAFEWAQSHDSCACCWKYSGMIGVILQTHHICKQGRSDEPCNFLRLCERCHRLAEMENIRDDMTGELFPKLTLGICLGLKKESDKENWRPERLEELRHSALPDIEKLPDVFLAERASLGFGNPIHWMD